MSDVFFCSLHTREPENNQVLNEVQYEGYQRMPVRKLSGVWKIDGIGESFINFAPVRTDGDILVRFFGIGQSPSGVGALLLSREIFPSILLRNGVTASVGFNWEALGTLLLYDGLTEMQCLSHWKTNREYVERGENPPFFLTSKQINCGKKAALAEIRMER